MNKRYIEQEKQNNMCSNEKIKHIFLIPLLNADIDELKKIESYLIASTPKIYYLVSIQDENGYFKGINKFACYKNVCVIKPGSMLDRLEHWQYIIEYAEKHLNFDSFSYVFSGDGLNA